jgi:hypothetical protein
MLNPILTGQFLSRIFTDQSGQQFRLTFFVTFVNGEARGHLVSAQPISMHSHLRLAGDCAPSSQAFCLPISAPKKELETAYIPSYTPIVSPFTELYFFTSQPTRAPSYR